MSSGCLSRDAIVTPRDICHSEQLSVLCMSIKYCHILMNRNKIAGRKEGRRNGNKENSKEE